MKLVLTGATGFVGRHLAKRLVDEGHELAVIVRNSSNLGSLHDILPQIRTYEYDGTYHSLLVALEATQPEQIIHVASSVVGQHSSEDIQKLVDSNVTFPTHLLEAMNQLGIRKVINTGTYWQHYGNKIYDPVNLYAATKEAFEKILCYYIEAKNFSAITLKLFDTFGPGDERPKLFSQLRTAARTGKPLRMSLGEQLLDLVYIDDVVEAYLLSIQHLHELEKYKCYAVSNPIRLSLREIVKVYSETVSRSISVEWGALPYRPREILSPPSGFEIVPGWKVNVSLREGIVFMESDGGINGLLAPSFNR